MSAAICFSYSCRCASPKSDLYKELLPALNSATLELLDHPKLLAQLVGLERRTARGGRDSIDHAVGGRDDVSNAVAGVCQLVPGKARGISPDALYSPTTGAYAHTAVPDDRHLPDALRPLLTPSEWRGFGGRR